MLWNPFPSELRDLLADLYPTEADIRRVLDDAGVPAQWVRFGDTAINIWHSALEEADRRDRVWTIAAVVNRDYGDNLRLTTHLARLLGSLDDEGKALPAHPLALLEALPLGQIPQPGPLPRGSFMPLRANPLFVGRQDDLRALAAALKGGHVATVVQIAAATGLGGIGKTQLAAEFVHRYGRYFAGGVFWLSFADPGAIPAQIVLLGGPAGMNLPGFGHLSLDDQVAIVQRRWREPIPRLLVFDNCETEDLLARWCPSTGGSRVLVTSRRSAWSPGLNVQSWVLGALARAESLALLGKFRPDLSENDLDLLAVAIEIGDLPLALHLAGSFLARYRHDVSPAAYLNQLRQPGLLQHRSLTGGDFSPTGHEQHVARTFALSLNRLNPEDPADELALDLLARLAYFAPGEAVPRSLLILTLAPGDDDSDVALAVSEAIQRLAQTGLMEIQSDGRLALHRLLASFVLASLGSDRVQDAVEEAVLREAERLNECGIPKPLIIWQAHLRHVTETALSRETERAAGLCNHLGYHLWLTGDYEGARPYYEQALAIYERVLETENSDLARSLNNMGLLLGATGDVEGARRCYERTLAICRRVLGEEHPGTAASLNNVGYVLQAAGNLPDARRYYEQALNIRERLLGHEHLDTAESLNNMGYLLYAMGDSEGARSYCQQALDIRLRLLGREHPDTAQSFNNVGMILQALGDFEQARPHLEQGLTICQQVLGEEHPNTTQSLNNMGYLLRALGDLEGAKPYYTQALDIRRRVLGEEHPDTAISLNNMGRLLRDMGDLAEATRHFEQALTILEQALPPDHPHIQIVRRNLNRLLADVHT